MSRDNFYYCIDFDKKQDEFVEIIKDKKKVGLFLGMGSGKTITSLTAIKDLILDLGVKNTLVVGPLKVANTVWKQEAAKWDHTSNVKIEICTGTPAERLSQLNKEADIHVINFENIPWLEEIFRDKWKWDALIVDESSSLKSHKSKRFKHIKLHIDDFEYTVLLSGTPSPNSYMDLWSQVYLLDKGERLGRNITTYKRNYFVQDGYMGYNWKLKEGAEEEIKKRISDICFTYEKPSENGSINLKRYIELPPKVKKQYVELEKEFIIELDNNENITAPSAANVSNKLLQICNGAVYDENRKVHFMHDEKIKALKELVEDNSGDNFLVAYSYKHDLTRLQEAFPDARTMSPDGREVDDWNKGKIKMLFLHPKSGGHGLNMQYGGSIVVWFGLPWSLELYQQLNKRLDRPGQTKCVRIVHLIVKKGMCEKVMAALNSKAKTQQQLMEYLQINFKNL